MADSMFDAGNLDKAIAEGANFFAYRLPGEKKVYFGSSRTLLPGIHKGGYVIAPFTNDFDRIFTIPFDNSAYCITDGTMRCAEATNKMKHSAYPFPQQSTSREAHCHEVKTIADSLRRRRGHCKTVAARVSIEFPEVTESELFSRLCERYPNAFVFCFHTPLTDTWIGASPEMILSAAGNTLYTVALAGTRPATSSSDTVFSYAPAEGWDEKNRSEQAIVADYISDEIASAGLVAEMKGPFTKIAGPVEHLCTEFSITKQINASDKSDAAVFSVADIITLLTHLAPTPALCGYPRRDAMSDINALESSQRGYYGGYSGPFVSPSDFNLYVNLRSCRLRRLPDNRLIAALFAGGGIMPDSNPDSEWEETERKLSTLRAVFSRED